METEKMVKSSAQWTAEKLAAFNRGRSSHQKMIRIVNPNEKINERYVSRRNFEKAFKRQGWFEIGADEDIAQHLMKNREKTPAEIILEQENERLKAEMAALRNGSTTTPFPPSTPASEPPTFSLSNDSPFNLDRPIPQITADLSTIERVSTLNEIMSAEVSGQNRKGVLSAIENRINEIGK